MKIFFFLCVAHFVLSGHEPSDENSLQLSKVDPDESGASTSSGSGNGMQVAIMDKLRGIVSARNALAQDKAAHKALSKNIRQETEREMAAALKGQLPETNAERADMLRHFVDRYFHFFGTPLADAYFKGKRSRGWFADSAHMTLRLAQEDINPHLLKISWEVKNTWYVGQPTNFQTRLSVSYDDKEELHAASVALVPEDVADQKHTFGMTVSDIRNIFTGSRKALTVKMTHGKGVLAEMKIDLDDIKFSYHTKESLDFTATAVIGYATRLVALNNQEIIGRPFFNYARTNIDTYCVLPNL